MRKELMNNLGLKILAFLAAVTLWFLVVNIDNPVTDRTIYRYPGNSSQRRYRDGQQPHVPDSGRNPAGERDGYSHKAGAEPDHKRMISMLWQICGS